MKDYLLFQLPAGWRGANHPLAFYFNEKKNASSNSISYNLRFFPKAISGKRFFTPINFGKSSSFTLLMEFMRSIIMASRTLFDLPQSEKKLVIRGSSRCRTKTRRHLYLDRIVPKTRHQSPRIYPYGCQRTLRTQGQRSSGTRPTDSTRVAQESSHRCSLINFLKIEYNGSERGLTHKKPD